jgi:hypothetical protein
MFLKEEMGGSGIKKKRIFEVKGRNHQAVKTINCRDRSTIKQKRD